MSLQKNSPTRLHDVECRKAPLIAKGLQGLLPHGLAWDAVRTPGTAMWQYFMAWALFLELFEERLCQFSQEIYCREAEETVEAWDRDYDIPDECLTLSACEKQQWQGGATCDYFIDIADRHGWAITACEWYDNDDIVFAGCAQVGCSYLGPKEEIIPNGTNLGVGFLQDFESSGYWLREMIGPLYTILPYAGHAHHWKVIVDLAASPAWTDVYQNYSGGSQVGCLEVGCATLCGQTPYDIICVLERLKPAHTVLHYEFINAEI